MNLFARRFWESRKNNSSTKRKGRNGKGKKGRAYIEPLEPRMLLSADIQLAAATALVEGMQQVGTSVDAFIQNDMFDTNLPFIVQVQQQGETSELVAPTLGTLFSVPVDPDGSGPGGSNATLAALDVGPDDRGGDGQVDAGEFLQGLFFKRLNSSDFLNIDLNGDGFENSADFSTYLLSLDKGFTINMPEGTPDITVNFDVLSALDMTESTTAPSAPAADLVFDLKFKMTVSQDMQIDLGTQADAYKLEAFMGTYSAASGTYDDKTTPMIPIDAALEFGFIFGVHTSGQQTFPETLTAEDFFIRSADNLNVSAKTDDPDDESTDITGVNFNLNIGFLGAEVVNGTIDYSAQIKTLLIDPDCPDVLGFTTNQYGVEQTGGVGTSGVVTGDNAVPSADLAHNAGFVLRIGNAGIATEVNVVADDNADLAGLVVDVNDALEYAGLGDLVDASLDGSNHLQFSLVNTTDMPLGFANEVYDAAGSLSLVPADFEFDASQSFLLSIGGALPTLVEVRFPDPAQSNIGFGTSQTATLPDLVANNPANANGKLSETIEILGIPFPDTKADFTIKITKSNGDTVTANLAVEESTSAPDPNTSRTDLVNDINQALAAAGLGALVEAKTVFDGFNFHIALSSKVTSISCIEITSADLVTQNDIGFETGQLTTLSLTAANAVTNPSFDDGNSRTDDSANIQLTVTTSSGPVTEVVSIASGNSTETDLAAAIDTAMSGYGIDAKYDGGKIVLSAQDASVLAFSIKTVNDDVQDLADDVNRALAQAGIGSKVEASVDGTTLYLKSIGEWAGQSLEVTKTLTLDAGVTYEELSDTSDTAIDNLFEPAVDEANSNIFFDLPIQVLDGLNFDPEYVKIAGSFSPFGELLNKPKPVAVYDDTGETSRFKINFDLDPLINDQDTPYDTALDSSALDEKAVLYNMAESLNFNLITSESMIGLLQNLGAALQDLAESGVFAAYDIPYADATWADLLNFSDSDLTVYSGLIDRSLIYETNGTGVDVSDDDPETPEDDAPRLLMRVVDDNGTPGAGYKDDDIVYLVPTFETAQQLASRLSIILELGDVAEINANYDPAGAINGVNELTYELYLTSSGRTNISLPSVPFEYDVALDDFSKLTLTATADPEELANQQVALQGYTGLNMTFGIDLSPPGLVIDDSILIAELNGGAGVDIKTQYAVAGTKDVDYYAGLSEDAHILIQVFDSGGNAIAFDVVEVTAAATSGNDRISELVQDINDAILDTDLAYMVVAGSYGQRLTLSKIGAAGTIQVGVLNLFGEIDTAYSELGFAALSAKASTVTAERSVPIGRLTGDATFEIDIADDGQDPFAVTVKQSATTGNVNIGDLVADIDNALAATDIGNELGFLAEQSVEGDTIYAEFNARLAFSRPVVFSVSVNDGEYVSAGVAAGTYADIDELVTAVNDGLQAAGLNDSIMAVASGGKVSLTAAFGTHVTDIAVKGTSKYLSSLIKADYDNSDAQGTRLVLSGVDRDTRFSVTASGAANSELGLPAAAEANQTDFVIYDSCGHRYNIALDSFVDADGKLTGNVGELIGDINNQITAINTVEYSLNSSDKTVVVSYNSTQTGLRLTDVNETPGTGQFRVETTNGSGAILTLGFSGAGDEGVHNEYGDGNAYLIEGGPIGETHLDDRFFVRDAELWGALGLQTTDEGVSGTGLFGIVGVDTILQGSIFAEFTAQLKNPATADLGGDVTLLELYNGARQGRITQDASFEITYAPETSLQITDTITVNAVNTSDNVSLADMAADLNKAIADSGLSGKIIARVAGTRIEFVSLAKDNPLLGGDQSVPLRVVPSGVGAAELGFELDGAFWLESVNVDGEQVLAGRSATRLAIAEPAVTGAYKLDIGSTRAGAIERGDIIYGVADTSYPDDNYLDPDDSITGTTALVLDVRPGFLILGRIDGPVGGEDFWVTDDSYVDSPKVQPEQRTSFGKFDITVATQPGFDDLGFGAGFEQFVGWSQTADFNITNFGNPYDPTAPVATFVGADADLDELYKLRQIGYGDIGSALNQLQVLLEDIEAKFTELTDPLPAINKSISSLLSLLEGYARGIDNINETFAAATLALDPEQTDIPALSLQEIPNAIRSAFGLLEGVDPDATDSVGWVQFAFDTATNNMLMMDLQLHESISTKLGLDIILEEQGLPNLTSVGVLKALGTLDINFNVGIDLYEPNNAWLFDTSNISASLEVVGEGQEYANGEDGVGLVFRASIGPLAVFIQDGEAYINAQINLSGLDFGGSDRALIPDVGFEDFTNRDSSVAVDITLPMFYGGEGPNDYVGDFRAYDDGANNIDFEIPDFSFIKADITSGDIEFDPFDNILLAFDTLNAYLESLSDQIAGDILGINLPFVGDQLADVLFIEVFRNRLYTTLKNGIETDVDPLPEDVKPLLEEALAGYLDGNVQIRSFTLEDEPDPEHINVNTWFREWDFTISGDKTILLDNFDLGIWNFGFDADTQVSVTFAWEMDIGFGVDFVQGAYINVSDFDLDEKEITIGLTIELPNLPASGQLGYLPLTVTNPGGDTGALINFETDVINGNSPGADHLGFSDIANVKPVATIEGTPLDGAAAAVTLHLVTEEGLIGLPSMKTDLVIDWSIAKTQVSDLTEGDAVAYGIHMMALEDMALDAGSVAGSLLGPLFGEIADFIEPFMPVIDTLTAPIPILSDIAGEPFTLLDLAGIFGSVDPSFIEAVADILDVISMIDDFLNAPDLPLGDLVLYNTDPADLNSNFVPNLETSDLADIEVLLTSRGDPSTTDGWTFDEAAYNAAIDGNEFLKAVRDGELADGLTMPILTDPRQGVMVLLNQNAIMVDYIVPPLMVEFDYLQVFPIWGPLAVSIDISFGFTLDLHSVGFDTYGYQRYAAGGFNNEALIFDGFYFNDLDGEGVDAPEVLFTFGLVGAAELNLGIARAGVEGGINAEIYFDWYDPVPDGRVHISEMINSIWADDNPIAVFDVGGALTFQMSAFLEISMLGIDLDFPITPEITLFDFEIPFERPPVLATKADNTLILNIGPNAEDRLNGNTSDTDEDISVRYDSGTLYVDSGTFPVSKEQEFTGINHIIAIGGQGNDTITLDLGDSGITYEVYGGSGDDTITVKNGTPGEEGGTIRGGVGNDTLTGGDSDDIIYGEEGNDTITGGAGYDILFGDFGRVFENLATADPLISSRITDADGVDTIDGGGDDDIIIGGGGNDILSGNGGNDVIIGDGGRFAYDEVDGHFAISAITGTSLWNDPDDETSPYDNVYPYEAETVDTSTPTDPDTISRDIDKIYNAMMATFSGTDLGLGGNDTISGGEGGDLILGGAGDDLVSGDAGDDLILGGKGFDEIYGGTKETALGTVSDKDTIFGGDQADTIYGCEDNDVISGGAGNDYIHGDNEFGNEGDDVMKGDSGADVMFGDAGNDQVFGQTEPDVLFGGAGNDLVVGGTGADIMFGDDGVVAKLDDAGGDGPGSKIIYNTLYITESDIDGLLADVLAQEGDFNDADNRTIDLIQTMVVETDGNDFLSGDAGDDIMLGGGGNDKMGGDVDPRLTSAIEYDENDQLIQTPVSEDVMIGDGGRVTFYERHYRSIETVYADTSAWTPGAYEFVDTIYGDNGNDYIFGGQDGDILAGGHGPKRGATDPGAADNDVIIGDNGELLFADKSVGETPKEKLDNFGRLTTIQTTDVKNDTGGADTVYGEEGADVIMGGVNNGGTDKLYGDYYDYGTVPMPEITIGNDVILGDNGVLYFAYDQDTVSTTDDDTNLDTLDLIRSEPYAVDKSTDPETINIVGGTDIIDGSFGYDVLIGGVAGDKMYGDDETASNGADDGEDIMLGDNGDIFLIGAAGRLLVQVTDMPAGTAVDLIKTTDTEDKTGGADTMSGNAKADIMLGGVNFGGEDYMYGDRGGTVLSDLPTAASISNDGDDILLGDNGLLDFTYDPADYPTDDQSATPDTDRNTLDLIRSREDGLGGKDVISGNKGLDVVIGGTGGDEIFGDDAKATAGADDKGDLLLGDNADIFLVAKGTYSTTLLDLKPVLPLGLDTDSYVKTIRTTDTLDPVNTGGIDTISGNADNDIIAGGVKGDTIYGDQQIPNADTEAIEGDDIILGDNGAFEWLSNGRLGEIEGIDIQANNPDLYEWFYDLTDPQNPVAKADTDLGTLDLVTTEQPTSGGQDTIYGDNGSDIVFGGTDSDTIYGDDGIEAALPEGSGLSTNSDLLFGDHGRIYPQFSTLRTDDAPDWRDAFNSRNFFAIDIGNAAGGQGDRMWGEEGDDTMVGQQGDDRMWGGSGDDDMTGGHNVAGGYDELGETAAINANAVVDVDWPDIGAVNDLMDGGTGFDSMAGDNAIIWRRGDDLSPRFRELTADSIYTTTNNTITANIDPANTDTAWENDPDGAVGRDIQLVDHSDDVQDVPLGRFGFDVMAGGAGNDVMFGQLGNDLMQGDGEIVVSGAYTDPAYLHYDITAYGLAIDDYDELVFYIPERSDLEDLFNDADDYMEGNGGSDLMYGGLGQDDMVGGSSALFGLDDANAAILGVSAEELRPDASDVIYGGAGNPVRVARNDFVGLNDTYYGTDAATVAVPMNDDPMIPEVDRHSLDSDFIMGDNANVYRLVGTKDYDGDKTSTYGFLQFNYDQTSGFEDRGGIRIIPRTMQQLDYTLGGGDYAGGSYNSDGQATPTGKTVDNGLADLIYGESGDDKVFGMTGSDIIFGNSDDDDIVGGYGNDWISGGTGQDGVLGDDGLIYTSRNSTAGEPLNSVAGLLANDPRPKYADGNVLDEVIKTPGEIQYALINQTGELKKSVDLVPFSYDRGWVGDDDEFPDELGSGNIPYADDIIFGGLGNDWLHGGSGDDSISGAEALGQAWVPAYNSDGDLVGIVDLGYDTVGIPSTMNPGNVLSFNTMDEDGQHQNNRYRAGEFDLYDEYDPLRKILLTPAGELYQGTGGTEGTDYFQFLLNFNEEEGVVREAGIVPKATGQQTETYPQVNDDGGDAIFGDLGNDWLVGGTGADDIYGGWGNDLLNADDNQDTNGGLNDSPDTHPFYQDRAYGGAGRDVLIGNTGGDRLIDWVGEYNSYLVPYAPFGQASVSRTLQPFLPEFLYALSAGDGADFTRHADTGADALRNGEPEAELGLVLQKDTAWQDQTGAPADPQAGNIPGGARDVLRSAGFNDGTSDSDGFYVDSGVWSVVSGRYQVAPTALGGDAVSVFYVDEYIPHYFEMLATVRAVKPTGGYNANAYLIFDYQSPDNFKYAGVNVSTSKLVMGYRDATGWHDVIQTPYTASLSANVDYSLFLSLNGNVAILKVNNRVTLTHTFAMRVDEYGIEHFLNEGMVGVGANNSKAQIDNVVVQRLAPQATLVRTVEFTGGAADSEVYNWLFPAPPVQWMAADGRYIVSPGEGAIESNLVNLKVAPASVLGMSATFSTAGEGGFAFDYYSPEDFKFVVVSADTAQLQVGHFTSRTGWVVDAQKSLDPLTGDAALGITIADSTVSVTLNDSAALSFVYNSLVTDGAFGLLARNGEAAFDTFTIMTDDPAYSTPALPEISISDATVKEGNSGTQAVTLTFALSEAADTVVSVDYTTVDGAATAGTDYQSVSDTLTFAAGETSKQVTFYVIGDNLEESDETFSVVLSNAAGATIADGAATVTVTDDDTIVVPGISIAGNSVIEGNRTNKTSVIVTVTLSQASSSAVSVQLATQDGTAVSGSDYVAYSGTVTFAAGETSRTVKLTVNGDKTAEADETFNVIMSNPVGATIVDGSATVTILNDDGLSLKAAEVPAMADSPAALTSEDLDAIIAEAVGRWSAVIPDAGTELNGVSFRIADFTGMTLGITGRNVILIDSDAAGYGWFIDSTPSDDMEFGQAQSAAEGRIDLLTAVMHEMGHVLGFQDTAASGNLMSDELQAGVRYSPADLAASPTPGSPLSTFLQFRPPSNGIPPGWVFDDGTSWSTDYEGWWQRFRSWVTGSKPAHDALPAILFMREQASLGSMEGSIEDGARGIGKDISIAVSADHANAGASMGQGGNWAGDFVLNAGKKADPNANIRIEL